MPRIRTIKPEFCTSEQIGECSTSARLLFVTMWCFCDDAGRHSASVLRLKAECFPFDSFCRDEMRGMVDELLASKLLVEYEHKGDRFWQVTGWKHQKIDRPTYKYGPFNDDGSPADIDECSTNAHRGLDEASPPEGKGRERKGREGSLSTASASDAERSASARRTKPNIYTQEFDLFWKTYWNRKNKAQAAKAFQPAIDRIIADTSLDAADGSAALEFLLDRTRAYKATIDDDAPERKLHASTYLNNDRFLDELTPSGPRVLTADELTQVTVAEMQQ